MTGTIKATCQAAAVALLLAVATTAPAKAQFGGGSDDMMTQMAPMLEMMKAKMGKKRFAMLMQTAGPMMANMMEGNGGLGGGFGGLGGGFGGLTGGGITNTGFMSGDTYQSNGFSGGGDFMGFLGGSGMTAMLPQMMSMINTGGRTGRRAKKH